MIIFKCANFSSKLTCISTARKDTEFIAKLHTFKHRKSSRVPFIIGHCHLFMEGSL